MCAWRLSKFFFKPSNTTKKIIKRTTCFIVINRYLHSLNCIAKREQIGNNCGSGEKIYKKKIPCSSKIILVNNSFSPSMLETFSLNKMLLLYVIVINTKDWFIYIEVFKDFPLSQSTTEDIKVCCPCLPSCYWKKIKNCSKKLCICVKFFYS